MSSTLVVVVAVAADMTEDDITDIHRIRSELLAAAAAATAAAASAVLVVLVVAFDFIGIERLDPFHFHLVEKFKN